tara:strand:- start:210055 stop:210345 length:291 start_codon:yes stop_codon:yes gene_type:complete
MYKILLISIIGLILSCVSTNAKIHAKYATSTYAADILFKVVEYGGKKWYIGKCLGDIVASYKRIAIKQVDYGGGDVIKVTLVPDRYRADIIICIRE